MLLSMYNHTDNLNIHFDCIFIHQKLHFRMLWDFFFFFFSSGKKSLVGILKRAQNCTTPSIRGTRAAKNTVFFGNLPDILQKAPERRQRRINRCESLRMGCLRFGSHRRNLGVVFFRFFRHRRQIIDQIVLRNSMSLGRVGFTVRTVGFADQAKSDQQIRARPNGGSRQTQSVRRLSVGNKGSPLFVRTAD